MKYKSVFQGPDGAKLIEASAVQISEHCLSTITHQEVKVELCIDCPLRYILSTKDESDNTTRCLLLEHTVTTGGLSVEHPKCTVEGHRKFITDLINKAYG